METQKPSPVAITAGPGGAEDQAVMCDIQKTLYSRANVMFTVGLFDGAISHFHRSLTAALKS